MPVTKSNLSTTAHTRLLAALPSKVYLAMHMILGGDGQARIKINELARTLVLNYFVDAMKGGRFLTETDLETLGPMLEMQNFDLLGQDWDELVAKFESRGDGNPSSPAYIVQSLADLEADATPAPEQLLVS